MTSAVPLYLEPLVGWRVWHVQERRGEPRLLSWTHTGVWPAGRRMEAECRCRIRTHRAPVARHRCGIYALRRRADAEGLMRELFALAPPGTSRLATALGRVSLWGRVMEGEEGWRAEYAYPYDLEVYGASDGVCQALADAYTVDVRSGEPSAQLLRSIAA